MLICYQINFCNHIPLESLQIGRSYGFFCGLTTPKTIFNTDQAIVWLVTPSSFKTNVCGVGNSSYTILIFRRQNIVLDSTSTNLANKKEQYLLDSFIRCYTIYNAECYDTLKERVPFDELQNDANVYSDLPQTVDGTQEPTEEEEQLKYLYESNGIYEFNIKTQPLNIAYIYDNIMNPDTISVFLDEAMKNNPEHAIYNFRRFSQSITQDDTQQIEIGNIQEKINQLNKLYEDFLTKGYETEFPEDYINWSIYSFNVGDNIVGSPNNIKVHVFFITTPHSSGQCKKSGMLALVYVRDDGKIVEMHRSKKCC